jgi:acyl-homoserine-lactone acylase
MVSSTVTVGVRDRDDVVRGRERTLWSSHYGPMLNFPLFGWSEEWGFTFREANTGNGHFLSQFVGMNTAAGLDEFRAVFERENGIPWVNTVAADSSGRVWYIDASRTPALSDEGERGFRHKIEEEPLTRLLYQNKVAVLDGSNPAYEWEDRPGAPAPGLVPFGELPQLSRHDWVVNANESHWLANPEQPLTNRSVSRDSILGAQRIGTECFG